MHSRPAHEVTANDVRLIVHTAIIPNPSMLNELDRLTKNGTDLFALIRLFADPHTCSKQILEAIDAKAIAIYSSR